MLDPRNITTDGKLKHTLGVLNLPAPVKLEIPFVITKYYPSILITLVTKLDKEGIMNVFES